MPTGLALDPATGVVRGTIGATAFDDQPAGIYDVTIDVVELPSDTGPDPVPGAIVMTVPFRWTVVDTNFPPVLDPVGDQTATEGQLVDLLLTASDPDPRQNLVFEASGLSAGLVVTGNRIQGPLTAASTASTRSPCSSATTVRRRSSTRRPSAGRSRTSTSRR